MKHTTRPPRTTREREPHEQLATARVAERRQVLPAQQGVGRRRGVGDRHDRPALRPVGPGGRLAAHLALPDIDTRRRRLWLPGSLLGGLGSGRADQPKTRLAQRNVVRALPGLVQHDRPLPRPPHRDREVAAQRALQPQRRYRHGGSSADRPTADMSPARGGSWWSAVHERGRNLSRPPAAPPRPIEQPRAIRL